MSALPPDQPNGELNIAIMGVVEAADAFHAYHSLSRVRNSQDRLHKDMDEATIKQRQTFLDVGARVLHAEALNQMDAACLRYLRIRGQIR